MENKEEKKEEGGSIMKDVIQVGLTVLPLIVEGVKTFFSNDDDRKRRNGKKK